MLQAHLSSAELVILAALSAQAAPPTKPYSASPAGTRSMSAIRVVTGLSESFSFWKSVASRQSCDKTFSQSVLFASLCGNAGQGITLGPNKPARASALPCRVVYIPWGLVICCVGRNLLTSSAVCKLRSIAQTKHTVGATVPSCGNCGSACHQVADFVRRFHSLRRVLCMLIHPHLHEASTTPHETLINYEQDKQTDRQVEQQHTTGNTIQYTVGL